ncbi:MAG: hypothetical protein JWM68_1451 [Verrucomicrobiales bacterium]|nr:hypothetical protein [Verrucomicrobiales bacterium]
MATRPLRVNAWNAETLFWLSQAGAQLRPTECNREAFFGLQITATGNGCGRALSPHLKNKFKFALVC